MYVYVYVQANSPFIVKAIGSLLSTHTQTPLLSQYNSFLGSEKYPGENEYKRYLSAHGGRSNASTSMQLTNYKFEVLADHAEMAVDIFSNFFIAPLFTASGTSREVQAVDSENSKNLTMIHDDDCKFSKIWPIQIIPIPNSRPAIMKH